MNPGDRLSVHMYDAAAVGGGKALKVVIDDLTTHQVGSMQASAHNGFMTHSIVGCGATPFNFQPEYATAAVQNIVPWTALATNISTEFETGHYEPCTSLSNPLSANPADASDPDGTFTTCSGPYEGSLPEGAETSDALCYQQGDTHAGYAGVGTSTAPDALTGCDDNWFQNGDLDFDGSAYWPEWPTSTTAGKYPSTFQESAPTTVGSKQYSDFFFQTDVALSELGCSSSAKAKCTVPPKGPGHFYPYWSLVKSKAGACTFEFGNVSKGTGFTDFSKDAQYGTVQFATLGYPEFEGKLLPDTCK